MTEPELLQEIIAVRERQHARTVQAGEAPDVQDAYYLSVLEARLDLARCEGRTTARTLAKQRAKKAGPRQRKLPGT